MIEYKNADGERQTLARVEKIEDNGDFLAVTYHLLFGNKEKTTNIRKDRVIRYDEP